MSEKFEFTTPVGRLVGGDLFVPREKDFHGQPLMTKDGKPRKDYIIQLALRKDDPAVQQFWSQVYQVGASSFPSLFSTGQAPPGFSFKMTDGDSRQPNKQGRIPAEREGYPGHYVFTFKSNFAPTIVDRNKMQVTPEQKAVKRGDYIRIGGTCTGNKQQNNPGVYLNASMVQICGFGEEIRTGPTADELFADDIQLPAGASATPTAPTAPLPGGAAPPAPTPPAPPAGTVPAPTPVPAPAPGAAPAPVPPNGAAPPPPNGAGAPAPMPGFGTQQPGTAPVAPAPPAPAPAAGPKQTKPGSPYTYEQLAAQGWTEDDMRAQGYL